MGAVTNTETIEVSEVSFKQAGSKEVANITDSQGRLFGTTKDELIGKIRACEDLRYVVLSWQEVERTRGGKTFINLYIEGVRAADGGEIRAFLGESSSAAPAAGVVTAAEPLRVTALSLAVQLHADAGDIGLDRVRAMADEFLTYLQGGEVLAQRSKADVDPDDDLPNLFEEPARTAGEDWSD
jgi:hypothetical protein